MPPATDAPSSAFAFCWQSAAKVATAESVLTDLHASGLANARESRFVAARKYLPSYLVFAADGRLRRELPIRSLRFPSRIATRKHEPRNVTWFFTCSGLQQKMIP